MSARRFCLNFATSPGLALEEMTRSGLSCRRSTALQCRLWQAYRSRSWRWAYSSPPWPSRASRTTTRGPDELPFGKGRRPDARCRGSPSASWDTGPSRCSKNITFFGSVDVELARLGPGDRAGSRSPARSVIGPGRAAICSTGCVSTGAARTNAAASARPFEVHTDVPAVGGGTSRGAQRGVSSVLV
jgi:hypothetical protein